MPSVVSLRTAVAVRYELLETAALTAERARALAAAGAAWDFWAEPREGAAAVVFAGPLAAAGRQGCPAGPRGALRAQGLGAAAPARRRPRRPEGAPLAASRLLHALPPPRGRESDGLAAPLAVR